ncbi:hypothetical protein COCMIDRAFT_87109 [Bipolaris oryzae ATCC 44560]|uniref:Uncharacterized protein n=1 Tax=Bipolaris oryzae ATCC 44560 TaxID=930090 RepID=W6ZEP5_COCMI|nr:uncharacterized protein COCMIDRAFT_87109 [Bipolaris oryzae ATCC 44560]EUC48490.1 hypothetical protein COCMIDRAFT_87109 [Bipolaris oryzae ATCC 44560]
MLENHHYHQDTLYLIQKLALRPASSTVRLKLMIWIKQTCKREMREVYSGKATMDRCKSHKQQWQQEGALKEEYSEKKYTSPSSRPSPLPSVMSTYPSPQEWLQRLSLQGDHATTPFDYPRATRILGLGQGASPIFASSATLQVPDSSNTHGSALCSSSETLTNQSSQERPPNHSHLDPSQPRPSSGGEDDEPSRPTVVLEEYPPAVRVIQPRLSVSQIAISNFQELLSDNDPGPPYPGDGDHLPTPPPFVDDSGDLDIELVPRIVMNPSMPTRSRMPAEHLLQSHNSNEPGGAGAGEENAQPQTMQTNNQGQDPGRSSTLRDLCDYSPELCMDVCNDIAELAASLCVIL